MEEQEKQRELAEAVAAGSRALMNLRRSQEFLDKAANWGLFDMLAGGIFATLGKHQKIREAQDAMEEARQSLRAFEKELQDVNLNLNLDLEIGEFLTFADYFLDNVFVDVMVQSRLSSAAGELERTRSDVRGILTKLYPLLGEEERE